MGSIDSSCWRKNNNKPLAKNKRLTDLPWFFCFILLAVIGSVVASVQAQDCIFSGYVTRIHPDADASSYLAVDLPAAGVWLNGEPTSGYSGKQERTYMPFPDHPRPLRYFSNNRCFEHWLTPSDSTIDNLPEIEITVRRGIDAPVNVPGIILHNPEKEELQQQLQHDLAYFLEIDNEILLLIIKEMLIELYPVTQSGVVRVNMIERFPLHYRYPDGRLFDIHQRRFIPVYEQNDSDYLLAILSLLHHGAVSIQDGTGHYYLVKDEQNRQRRISREEARQLLARFHEYILQKHPGFMHNYPGLWSWFLSGLPGGDTQIQSTDQAKAKADSNSQTDGQQKKQNARKPTRLLTRQELKEFLIRLNILLIRPMTTSDRLKQLKKLFLEFFGEGDWLTTDESRRKRLIGKYLHPDRYRDDADRAALANQVWKAIGQILSNPESLPQAAAEPPLLDMFSMIHLGATMIIFFAANLYSYF